MRRKEILKILLIVLVALFIMFLAAALLVAGLSNDAKKEQERQEALANITPTQGITPTASPSPTPRPTATPTPVVTRTAAFNPDDYWDDWYSTDGTATIYIYNISLDSVTFSFNQTDTNLTEAISADITAKVAGNAATFSFTDSNGNTASGSIIFDNGALYVSISTAEPVTSLYPHVECNMSRTKTELIPEATPTPEVTPTTAPATDGDYIFSESSSRYLTDEEVSALSSDQLELAKNEIYARHGRQFVTDYIAEYFNSKSWYQGTIDPETFDAQQDSIFNEYELANINKIAQWEEQKASEGN